MLRFYSYLSSASLFRCASALGFSLLFAFAATTFANFAQQQIAPLFPPQFCQRGGAPQANRRIFAYRISNSAALLVLPAVHIGGNFANSAISAATPAITIFQCLTLSLTKD